MAGDTHSIWSDKALLLRDGETGKEFKEFRVGRYVVSWRDKTRYGFHHIQATVMDGTAAHTYEFVLVGISNADDEHIDGLWDIRRDSALVVKGGVGRAYGLNIVPAAPPNYFKLSVGDSQNNTGAWAYVAYFTHRHEY